MAKLQSPPSLPPHSKRFKGVRMRNRNRWVSEIRIPHSREKIWLGSYSTPERAARAFDAAVLLLRGSSSTLNLPDAPPHLTSTSCVASPRTIQAAAAAAANDYDFLKTQPVVVDDESHNCLRDEAAKLQLAEPSRDTLRPEAECCSSSLSASSPSDYLTSSDESNQSYSPIHQIRNTSDSTTPQTVHFTPCKFFGPIEEQDVLEDPFPFGPLSPYGFSAISGAVTISERFDIDVNPSTDGCLWNL